VKDEVGKFERMKLWPIGMPFKISKGEVKYLVPGSFADIRF
jgi:hypothetical protein